MKTMTSFLLSLSICAAIVTGAHATADDAGIGPGSALLAPVLPDAGSASAPAATASPLPDAATVSPIDQGSFVWKLYKAGHLVPAIIVALFFVLMFAEKRVAWLRTGYRKVIVSSVLVGLGMLAERVSSGTTPNFMMVMGALGAGFTMWMKTHGEPAPAK